jgi:SAM-dependent methyltransferase
MLNAYRTFCTSIEKNAWFGVLLFVITILMLVSAYNKFQRLDGAVRPYSGSFMESFVQSGSESSGSSRVVVKTDGDIKDAFYAAVYDDIFTQRVTNAHEVGAIINQYPDISNQAVALDIGAGTGAYMRAFIKHGITDITGIEPSGAMIAQAKKAHPRLNLNIVKGDPTTITAFKPESFTLVTLLNFEVYHIRNTPQLFANVYEWLKPGGYFVLHLVDPRRFNAASLLGLTQPSSGNRERAQNAVKFRDFEYTADVQVFPNDMVQYMEVFTDNKTGQTRKNVRNFRLPSPQTYIETASEAGFNMLGQIDLVKAHKAYQYFYLFYKPAN